MLFTEKIEGLVEVGIASQHVIDEKNTRPLNFMLITLSGGGKSQILLEKYGQVEGVKAFGDVTYARLADKWLDKIHRREIGTLIFPEFNKILGRRASVAQNTVGLIDEVCEEGCPSIDLPYFSMTWNPPVRANVIIGLTPSFYNAHLIDWWGFGFAQRFIPVTWSYSDYQEEKILHSIIKQRHLKERVCNLKIRDKAINLPEEYSRRIKEHFTRRIVEDQTDYVEKLYMSKRLRFDRKLEKELPFRTQQRLQKALKSIALLNGHTTAKKSDYIEFIDLFRFMNLKFREIS